MFYGESVQEVRQFYFATWQKYKQNQPLIPLEQQILAVILDHPEYHALLDNPEQFQERNYYPEFGETNPFLHMGLHLAIREQIDTNRPTGIAQIFKNLKQKNANPLDIEHMMMEQLAEFLWLAQKNNLPPDEEAYLQALMELEHRN